MLAATTSRRRGGTIRLGVQVGAVAALFLAALATLAVTSLAVIGREGRRAEAERSLERAGAELGRRGREALAGVPDWPGMSESAWGRLDRRLAAEMPEGLVESELFGHERGAFTGADRRREGRFERAAGGSIFLDEIGELPPPAQAKLLRVLQQREYERVGGTETIRADARIVSATNRDLPAEVAAGRFREDLFYRLDVVRIAIPPLRERREDVEPLALAILRRLEARYGWSALSLAPESLAELRRRDWAGNVRQLENVLARAAIAARGRPILPDHLGDDADADDGEPPPSGPEGLLPLRAVLAEVERRTIRRALDACGCNRTRTAEALGISRRLLFDKIREYDLLG